MRDPGSGQAPAPNTNVTGLSVTVDDLPDAFVAIDGEGAIVSVNRAACALFGYRSDELIGKPITTVMPVGVGDGQRFARDANGAVQTTSGGRTEAPSMQKVLGDHRSGAKLPLELRWSALGQGGPAAYVVLARDASQHLSSQTRAVTQTAELKAVNSELWVLYKVSSVLIRNVDMQTLLSDVLDTITDLDVLNIDRRGGIFVVEGDYLRLVAHRGHSEAFLRGHDGLKVGECLCGSVARSGEVLVVTNSRQHPAHTHEVADSRPHGHVIVPLKAKREVVGVMYLYLPANRGLDGVTIKTLEAVGHQIGMAMENVRLYETTRALSLHDPLTGLANRRLMNIFLERYLASSRRSQSPFSLLMVDIDHFKRFNDSHGHAAGDTVLCQVARTISATLRESDLASRHGGEEFLVLLPETSLNMATEAAERVCLQVSEQTNVTVSIGVACAHPTSARIQPLIDEADGAMYEAKRAGRNRVAVSWASRRRADSLDRRS